MVSDGHDFEEMPPWFPELPLSAIAAVDHSPLPQFGSHTLSIDGACDLGSVCTGTGQEAKQIQEDLAKVGGDVIHNTATPQS